MDKKTTSISALGLLLILFFAVNILADVVLRGTRIDLTQAKLYTLSSGSKNILSTIKEPITFKLYFSESLTSGQPQLQTHGKRVRELLEEYELRSRGNITLHIIDPEPFSEGEDEARQAGLSGVPAGRRGENFYFGLVATNSTDGRETVPFFDPGQERFLEYELSRLVYNLANPDRKTIGIISSLPITGGPPPMPGRPPQGQPWQIMREIGTLFDVEVIEPSAESIGENIDALLLIHPKNLTEPMLQAIDTFVIGGGAAVVFLDPLCEKDIPLGAEQNPMAALQADRSSNLSPLLESWGVTIAQGQIAADLDNAMRGQSPDGAGVVSYVQYLSLGKDQVDTADAVTGQLTMLQIGAGGVLIHDEGASTTWTPLVTTSENSMLLDVQRVAFFPRPQELVAEFVPRGEGIAMAGRITGEATSAFTPDKTGDINVIVVADADMLSDELWIRPVGFGNTILGYQKLSDNGTFLINALDNMAGSSDLISIRARGTFVRPFTLVEKIQREAEQKYLAEAQGLEEKRGEAQAKLDELQKQRPDAGGMIVTAEQQAEIESFQAQLVATNAQLRQVRYELRKDVESLGLKLKIINIGAAPLVVALAAIGLGMYRNSRRKADRQAMAGQG